MLKEDITTYNHTPLTLEQINNLPVLGLVVSKWRERNITLYNYDEKHVISVGITFKQTMLVACIEEKSSWQAALNHFKWGKGPYVSE